MSDWKILASLPADYEYKIINVDGKLLIVGAHEDKPPIAFRIKDDKLIDVKVDF